MRRPVILVVVVVSALVTIGCGEDHARPRPTATLGPPTPAATSTPAVGVDPPCTYDGSQCGGGCLTGPCIYDERVNRCVCQPAFDFACNDFALGGCPGHSCFAPGQVCVRVSDDPLRPGCGCVDATSTAEPKHGEPTYDRGGR